MIQPETLQFLSSSPKEKLGKLKYPSNCISDKGLYQCHLNDHNEAAVVNKITIVIPGLKFMSTKAEDVLSNDQDYYQTDTPFLQNILFSKEFIKAFVMEGQLFLQTKIDDMERDDGFIIYPDGQLILFTDKDAIQTINIDGMSTYYNGKSRCVSVYNLKDIFDPKNGGYAKTLVKFRESFRKLWHTFKNPIEFTWKSNDESVCPSSIAKFFCENGAVVIIKTPVITSKFENHKIPSFFSQHESQSDERDYDFDLIEDWIGALLIGIKKKQLDEISNFCGMTTEKENILKSISDNIHIIEAEGIYSPSSLSQIFEVLHDTSKNEHVPWIIISVEPSIGSFFLLKSNLKVKSYRNVSRTFIISPNCTITRSKRC